MGTRGGGEGEYTWRLLGSSKKDESGAPERDLSWGERHRGRGAHKPVDDSRSHRVAGSSR